MKDYQAIRDTAKRIETTSDGITVWINGFDGLLGRFGRQGIDIHRNACEQSENGECLYCTHCVTTAEDWPVFVEKMKELHDVVVVEKYRPNRFRKERRCLRKPKRR